MNRLIAISVLLAGALPAAVVAAADVSTSAASASASAPLPRAPGASSSATPSSGAPPARLDDLERRIDDLSRQLADERAARAATAPAASASASAMPAGSAEASGSSEVPSPAPSSSTEPSDLLHGIAVTAYVQGQLENHGDSEDQVRPGASLVNQNRFLVRRARLKIEREWDFTSLMLELNGDTTKGPAFTLHHAEPSIFYHKGPPGTPPLVKLTIGLFDVPFGYELVESPRTRFFMERSTQSRAFFPSEPDLGIRLSGKLDWFRYAFAFINGNPNGVAGGFPLQDPNNNKDFVARVGADIEPAPKVKLSAGVSMLTGKGFSKGTDPTKAAIVWRDGNENNMIDPSEIDGSPGSSARPSLNFDHWAVGGDLQLDMDVFAPGKTRLYGEIQIGSNMDRALYVADPTSNGLGGDSRELGWYAGFVQEITPYGVLGFRFDYYDPNADIRDLASGHLVLSDEKIRTYAPLVGLVVPGRARLVFEYDFINDHMGRDSLGAPTDLKNDTWTLRLQGEL